MTAGGLRDRIGLGRESRVDFLKTLREKIGEQGPPLSSRDAVNQAMIRHWCDAMEDDHPVYTDPEWAARSQHGEIVAPPAMLNAWTMQGLRPPAPSAEVTSDPASEVYEALDRAGFTSVVATNSEHEYDRYLRLGDLISGTSRLTEVSEEKTTGLGVGHFVTTETDFSDQGGNSVGRMLFRILKFRPGTGRASSAGEASQNASAPQAGERPPRPSPAISRDTQFFWEGLENGELRIQRCEGCAELFHPPVVRCPACGGYSMGWQTATGRAHLYSYVAPEYPHFAAFDPGYIVGLVELEEGTRLLTNIVDVDPEEVRVGMSLELVVRSDNSDCPLPMFRPVRPERRTQTPRLETVQVGERLAACPIPITTTSIVATAMASRDYQDVHHDRELAQRRGSPDIFMNILTTSGLCARYVTDWGGPDVMLKRLAIRLGVPNYPGDTMTMTGRVEAIRDRQVELSVSGRNRVGPHVTGEIQLEWPRGGDRTGPWADPIP
ncbi:MAG: hypothetical protein CBC48_14575 [bacterium TMED88]|nr:protein dehydratase [Deltaproteobacteria bacterium]OUV27180.1 MAG: hypothetical protein CBC48_14575 [bacterium TMED88]